MIKFFKCILFLGFSTSVFADCSLTKTTSYTAFTEQGYTLPKADFEKGLAESYDDKLFACRNASNQVGYLSNNLLVEPINVANDEGRAILSDRYREVYIDIDSLVINKYIYQDYTSHDLDGQHYRCEMGINEAIVPNTIFIGLSNLDDRIPESREGCNVFYNISRPFGEIYAYLDPQTNRYDRFDYENATEYDYRRIMDPNRYAAYLTKYPLTTERLQKYYNMGDILYQLKLYNEAILILTNIVTNYPDKVTAYLLIGDSYAALGANAEAAKNYSIFARLAKESGIKIPARITSFIN